MTTKSTVRFRAEGRRLWLERSTPGILGLGKPRVVAVPLDDWAEACPDAARAALAAVWASAGDGVAPDGNALVLTPAALAALLPEQAAVLGLPNVLPLSLSLTVRGQIHAEGFEVVAAWTSGAGQGERVNWHDGLLRWNGQDWVAPAFVVPVQAAVAQVNAAPNLAARAEALAALQEILDEHACAGLIVDRQIDGLRIRHAAAFALAIEVEEGSVRFVPRLFSRANRDAARAGAMLDSAADSLLPPALAKDWGRRALAGPGRDSYLLRDGSILVLDPLLARVLAALPRAAQLGAEDRRAFAIAPRPLLVEACGLARAQIDTLLIETADYIAVVRRLDSWRQLVRPWLALADDGRTVAGRGLCLGDGPDLAWLDLPAERLPMLLAQTRLALAGRQPVVTWGQTAIPATAATRTAVQALADLAQWHGDGSPPADLAAAVFVLRGAEGEAVSSGPLERLLPVAAPQPPAPAPIAWPATMATTPAPHQTASFAWLAERWRAGDGGAIWADAPGLDPAPALLGFIDWLGQQGQRPSLLVVAHDDMAFWQAQLAHHAPHLRVPGAGEEAGLPDLVLASYEGLRDDPQALVRQTFAALVLDRAEHLKTPDHPLTRTVRTLDARLRLAMLAPPLIADGAPLATTLSVIRPDAAPAISASASWILHRSREDCRPSLPPCEHHVVAAAMPPVQRDAYETLLHRAQALRGSEDAGRQANMLGQFDSVSRAAWVPGTPFDDPASVSGRIAALIQTLETLSVHDERAVVVCHDAALRSALAPFLAQRFGPHVTMPDPDRLARGDVWREAAHLLLLTREPDAARQDAMVARLHAMGRQHPAQVYWLQAAHPDPALAAASFDLQRDRVLRTACEGLLAPSPDPASLFEAVAVVPPPPQPAQPQAASAPELAPAPAPTPEPRKAGRLSLGNRIVARPVPIAVPAAPVAAAPVPPPPPPLEMPPPSRWASRVEFMEHRDRNLSIFQMPLRNDPALECWVIDPFAAAGAPARRKTAEFLRMLLGPQPILSQVRIDAFDGAAFSRDYPESDSAQHDDMQKQWQLAFPKGPKLVFRQHSRDSRSVMHDRSIRVLTQSGRKLIWDLGRGIDGVMLRHYRCVVTLTEL